jgi:hypothetical protein
MPKRGAKVPFVKATIISGLSGWSISGGATGGGVVSVVAAAVLVWSLHPKIGAVIPAAKTMALSRNLPSYQQPFY